jgi:hypothetical protein
MPLPPPRTQELVAAPSAAPAAEARSKSPEASAVDRMRDGRQHVQPGASEQATDALQAFDALQADHPARHLYAEQQEAEQHHVKAEPPHEEVASEATAAASLAPARVAESTSALSGLPAFAEFMRDSDSESDARSPAPAAGVAELAGSMGGAHSLALLWRAWHARDAWRLWRRSAAIAATRALSQHSVPLGASAIMPATTL